MLDSLSLTTAASGPWSTVLTSFFLVGLAEMGDKSQIVCMALAARHRHWPVWFGAATAFIGLNLLAVTLGAGLALWIPETLLGVLVTALFLGFGLHTLFSAPDDDCTEEDVSARPDHGVFLAALIFIFLAELGDKTQLAVAGMASALAPAWVWLGATLALLGTTALGVWAGSRLLRRLPKGWLHRVSGGLFLLFGLLAAASLLG